MKPIRCENCGLELTAYEILYYDTHCEECEIAMEEMIDGQYCDEDETDSKSGANKSIRTEKTLPNGWTIVKKGRIKFIRTKKKPVPKDWKIVKNGGI
jgi:hypothetical protein